MKIRLRIIALLAAVSIIGGGVLAACTPEPIYTEWAPYNPKGRQVCEPLFRGNLCQYDGPWSDITPSMGLRGPFPDPPEDPGDAGPEKPPAWLPLPNDDLVCLIWDWIKDVCAQWGRSR